MPPSCTDWDPMSGAPVSPVDSRRKSLNEALINALGAYPVGYALGIVILPASLGWLQENPLAANLAITAVYVAASFARSYLLRRVFERFGIDDNFVRLGIRAVRSMRVPGRMASLARRGGS